MSTYKEQLQGMSNEELIEHYRYMSKRKDVLMIKAELLHRLNEAERLRDMLKLARTHINIFTPMKHRNPELEVLIEQALTTPEPLKAK